MQSLFFLLLACISLFTMGMQHIEKGTISKTLFVHTIIAIILFYITFFKTI